jgi:peptidoglycan-associated lipoprotein
VQRLSRHTAVAFLAASLVSGLVACSHRRAVTAPTASPGTPAAEGQGSTSQAGPGAGTTLTVPPEPQIGQASPAGNPEAGVAAADLPADLAEINRAGYVKDAFFDTNKSELRADARDALAADATWLKQHPSLKIQIEGHCDERNTEEYNLALGWRRANTVKGYLVSLGVDAARVATISYGEERPFAVCHEESCWASNRRAHLVITAR